MRTRNISENVFSHLLFHYGWKHNKSKTKAYISTSTFTKWNTFYVSFSIFHIKNFSLKCTHQHIYQQKAFSIFFMYEIKLLYHAEQFMLNALVYVHCMNAEMILHSLLKRASCCDCTEFWAKTLTNTSKKHSVHHAHTSTVNIAEKVPWFNHQVIISSMELLLSTDNVYRQT